MFGIFKNFVLEGRLENKNKNVNINIDVENVNDNRDNEIFENEDANYDANKKTKKNRNITSQNQGTKSFENQIADLRSLLLQRDTEISILVNMVNNGKNGDDVRASQTPITEKYSEYHYNPNTKNSESIRGREERKDNDGEKRGKEIEIGREVKKEGTRTIREQNGERNKVQHGNIMTMVQSL